MRRRSLLAAMAALGIPSIAKTELAGGIEVNSPGMLLISGFRGTDRSDPEVDLARRAREAGAIAGVILLDRNIRSPEQLIDLTASLREASPELPPIIAIDQDGVAP